MYRSRLAIETPTLLLVALLGFQSLTAQPAFAGATEWVDIEVVDGRLLVETEIAGISGYSLIDTGAQINAINGAFLAAMEHKFKQGRSIKISGAFGTSHRRAYHEIPVKIFGSEIKFHDLIELDFGSSDIQLIIGANFLKSFIFQFDYPNQRIRIITRDSLNLKKIKNIDSRKSSQGGSILVKVGLGERTDAWLTMDTGANGGIVVDRDLAKRLHWLDTYATVESEVSGVNSSGNMEHFRVPSIEFGPVTIENVLVSIPAQGESMTLFETYAPIGTRIGRGRKSKGLLGYDILQHFVVTIDYKHGHVHVYPGEKLPAEP